MNFDNFINLYSNIPADFDGRYGNQCMDLVHFYCYICFDIYDKSVLAADVAKNVWLKWNPAWNKYFTKEANGPTNFPSKGDIVIWDAFQTGGAGHIAIAVSANSMSFNSFDQNYPTGSYPHIQYHNYDKVLGWLKKI